MNTQAQIAIMLLLIFLANWAIGCASLKPEPTVSRFPALDCKSEPNAFRCKAWQPEPEIEYDDFSEVE